VFFMGGRPGTAQATASILAAKYPGMVIAGVSCPKYGFELSKETLTPVLDEICEAKPHVLFLALGAPKQEFFIGEHIRPLRIPLAVGIGGSFELLAGETHRAPQWMQDAGLEWAFRFAQEPLRLWRRYLLGNVEFLWGLGRWRFKLALRERRSRVMNSRTREI
jgi:N-acetylglucosaminyldiphosphoundecaprenol N-acetyl-beta-D-mannosaminyltransferase